MLLFLQIRNLSAVMRLRLRLRPKLSVRPMGVTTRSLPFLVAAAVWAHVQMAEALPRLPYNYSPSDRTHYCFWYSVQAAWGAEARFKGAPPAFRYVDRERLHGWFLDDNAPPDAVYLLDELGPDDRPLYEEVALAGWKRMDAWLRITPDMQQPDWVLLPVPFYYLCRDGG
jgi:hypothetical protein